MEPRPGAASSTPALMRGSTRFTLVSSCGSVSRAPSSRLAVWLFFPLLFAAAYRLPGGVAAVTGALGPFVVAGLSSAVLGHHAGRRALLAAALGVAGVALLVLRSETALDPVGLLAAAAGTLSMSTGIVLGRRWARRTGSAGEGLH